MAWHASYQQALHIVEVVYTGPTDQRDLQQATSHCIALAKANNTTRFLVDAAALELTASLIDVYNLPEKQYIEEGAERTSRIALIRPRQPRSQEAADFYETVCRNRGWIVKVVATRAEAVDWLLERLGN